MNKRFLITTSLEETWQDDGPVVFLGEWCRRFSRSERWSKMDAEILSYHWDDRGRLHSDYQYLKKFYEQLLKDLTVELNKLHGVDHSLRYWRILIGPWLGYFTQILFDRWTSIRNALDKYEISETIILVGQEEDFIPNDMTRFMKLIVTDEWNHFIYATILKQFTNVNCVEKKAHLQVKEEAQILSHSNWKDIIRRNLLSRYTKFMNHLTRESDAFFLATYLAPADEMKLHLRMGQLPRLLRPEPCITASVEGNKREWNVAGEKHSEFEACARALIPKHMPTIYLEGYHQLTEQVSALPWPKHPKVIWTSGSYSTDDVFKVYTAEKVEQGSPFVIGQHGGGHGTHLWAFYEEHQISICDSYLSWGWTDESQPKVKAVGELKAKHPLGVEHNMQDGALLVTRTLPRQSYHIFSSVIASQWLDYFNDQCAFVENLTEEIRDALTIRLSSGDYGWDQVARWEERFDNLRLDAGYTSIYDLVRQSRLYISTYNATTFLESFTMNVPTIMYWNENHWELRDSCLPYFNELKRVGIFHETPESAARHVVDVWDDVEAWWNSVDVQKALKFFKARFCHLPDNLLDRVEEALREVMPHQGN